MGAIITSCIDQVTNWIRPTINQTYIIDDIDFNELKGAVNELQTKLKANPTTCACDNNCACDYDCACNGTHCTCNSVDTCSCNTVVICNPNCSFCSCNTRCSCISYSDERLKDFDGKIENALYIVSQLNGYYFTENKRAEDYGLNNKRRQLGVSAQEIENVLPELITAAPFDIAFDENGNQISKSGENFKAVYYEKITPLLIEAIKELKAELDEFKKSVKG